MVQDRAIGTMADYNRKSYMIRAVTDFYTVFQTRRMAIANGTSVSFCNQPKAHYLATSRESRRYVVRRVQEFGYV